jgi:phage tail sheath protein FI
MLTLVLRRQSQWLVFEPQTREVQRQLKGSLTHLLRDLHAEGAFAGATEAESFFVRCDESINTTWSQGLGRLVAEVGVAPAQPLEYLVLRIAQDAEGLIGVEG